MTLPRRPARCSGPRQAAPAPCLIEPADRDPEDSQDFPRQIAGHRDHEMAGVGPPLDPRVRDGGDWGEPAVLRDPEIPASRAFFEAAARLMAEDLVPAAEEGRRRNVLPR